MHPLSKKRKIFIKKIFYLIGSDTAIHESVRLFCNSLPDLNDFRHKTIDFIRPPNDLSHNPIRLMHNPNDLSPNQSD
ncbi:MAG: hypothetical protein JNL70_21490 [Saprospiraceae bacterium]|nr:hypothetical protein [Saprospiraceae bacterium]